MSPALDTPPTNWFWISSTNKKAKKMTSPIPASGQSTTEVPIHCSFTPKNENKTWKCCCTITFKWLTNQKITLATHAHILSKWFSNFRKHGFNAYPKESKFQRLEAWIYKRIEIGGLHIEWKSVRIWIHPKAKNFFEVVQHGKLSWFWGIEDTIAVNGKEGKWEYLLTTKCHCELAWEGINSISYSWGCAKNFYRWVALTMKKRNENFRSVVQESIMVSRRDKSVSSKNNF